MSYYFEPIIQCLTNYCYQICNCNLIGNSDNNILYIQDLYLLQCIHSLLIADKGKNKNDPLITDGMIQYSDKYKYNLKLLLKNMRLNGIDLYEIYGLNNVVLNG